MKKAVSNEQPFFVGLLQVLVKQPLLFDRFPIEFLYVF
jgi:hypothetical protein